MATKKRVTPKKEIFKAGKELCTERGLIDFLNEKPDRVTLHHDTLFEKKLIGHQSFLLDPIKTVFSNKVFIDCAFQGPGALAIAGNTVLNQIHLVQCGHILCVEEDTTLSGIPMLNSCSLVRARFVNMTLIIPDSFKQVFIQNHIDVMDVSSFKAGK